MTPTLVSTKALRRGIVKMQDNNQVKHVVDAAGIIVALGSWMQLVPLILNVLAIGWYLVRFGEWIYSKVKLYKEHKKAQQNA